MFTPRTVTHVVSSSLVGSSPRRLSLDCEDLVATLEQNAGYTTSGENPLLAVVVPLVQQRKRAKPTPHGSPRGPRRKNGRRCPTGPAAGVGRYAPGEKWLDSRQGGRSYIKSGAAVLLHSWVCGWCGWIGGLVPRYIALQRGRDPTQPKA